MTRIFYLVVLSLGHFLTDINQGATPALLPYLKEAFGLSYTQLGTILMASNITSSVIQPIFGYLSDRSALRWLLPAGVFLAGFGIALSGNVGSYWLVLLSVAISGLGIAAYHPEASRTAHHIAGNLKATGVAIFSVGGNVGFAFGPVMVAFLVGSFGLAGTRYATILTSVMALAFVALIPKMASFELSERAAGIRTAGELPPNDWSSEVKLIGLVTIRSAMQFGVMSFLPFYYVNHLGGDKSLTAYLLFVYLGSGALGTLAGGNLADRFGSRTVLYGSFGLMLPLQIAMLFAQGWLIVPVLALAGFALVSTFTVALVMSQSYMPRNVAMASGLTIGFSIGMGGVTVTALGAVADRWGIPATFQAMTVLPVIGLLLIASLPTPSIHLPGRATS